jgi:hypothetical protein
MKCTSLRRFFLGDPLFLADSADGTAKPDQEVLHESDQRNGTATDRLASEPVSDLRDFSVRQELCSQRQWAPVTDVTDPPLIDVTRAYVSNLGICHKCHGNTDNLPLGAGLRVRRIDPIGVV